MADSRSTASPLVSVVLVTFRRRFVGEAIASVRHQTLDPGKFELIVVRNYDDPKLEDATRGAGGRSIRLDAEYFGAGAVAGVAASRGEIVTFLEDDDRFLPDKLASVLRSFQEDPSLGFYRNGFVVIDEQGRQIPDHPFRAHYRRAGERLGAVTVGGTERETKLRQLPPLGIDFNSSCMSARRALLQSFIARLKLPGPRLPDELVLFSALTSPMSLRIDPAVLTEYRIHRENISSGDARQADPFAARQAYARISVSSGPSLIQAVRESGNRTAIKEADGLWVIQRAYLAMRDPSTSRAEFAQLRHELTGAEDSYLVRSEPRLGTALWLFSWSPSLARWLYIRAIRYRSG